MSGTALRLPVNSPLPQSAAPAAHWNALRAGNVEWTIAHGCAGELLDANGLRWDDWKANDALEVIKTGPHRTVYRLHIASGDFYLKHFRMADWQAWLRNAFRASPAERELQAVLRIAALRLPTFEPVALGVCRRYPLTGDTYLISRAIPNAIPLDHYLLTEFSGRQSRDRADLRHRLACEMGRLAARLHAAGIEHVDLHAGNLLIRPNAVGGAPLLSLIDLHSVRFHSSLSQSRRDRNLAALHQFFAGRSTRADRHRFWRAYETELQSTTPTIPTRSVSEGVRASRSSTPSLTLRVGISDRRSHCARLERLLDQAAQAGWRRADRAWRRGNRHVRRLDAGPVHCRGLATLDVGWLESLRDNPETPFEQHLIRWCKQSARHRVAEVAIPTPCSMDCPSVRAKRTGPGTGDRGPESLDDRVSPVIHAYWKCVTESGLANSLRSRWRNSPVRRAWETGHALLRRGIDTPRPMLFVESIAPSSHRGYLLTEAVENSTTLAEFFDRCWPAMKADQRANWLTRHSRQLARKLRRLHGSGFDHRDLKFPNLLVSNDATDDRIWLLDLDAVRAWPVLPAVRAMQNLSRLNVSSLLVPGIRSTDRLRFLRWYLGSAFAAEWKLWWRRIARKSLLKIDRNHRDSRPLS